MQMTTFVLDIAPENFLHYMHMGHTVCINFDKPIPAQKRKKIQNESGHAHAASEMTYTVSGGALNSTQTKPKPWRRHQLPHQK